MSGTVSVTFCFDIKYKTPGLKKVLSFLLNNKANELFSIKYYKEGIKEESYDANIQLISEKLTKDTRDFFIMYEWKKNESNLIADSAHEINNYFESGKSDPFNLFHMSFLSGAFLDDHNAVFQEVEELASRFIIYYYAETNTIIYDSGNFEKNLRGNPKIQELISTFEKEFKTKLIKIGVSVSL